MKAAPFDTFRGKCIAFSQMTAHAEDLDLASAIRVAFTTVQPPNRMRSVCFAGSQPIKTVSTRTLNAPTAKATSPIIGQLVYERFGCFQGFMIPDEDQSSARRTRMLRRRG